MSQFPLAPRALGVLVLAFLSPRDRWRLGSVLSRLSGGGGGDEPPGAAQTSQGESGGWPLWLAILVTTVIAVVLSGLGIVLAILGGQAPGPYPPGP